jgi:hypothetical protein
MKHHSKISFCTVAMNRIHHVQSTLIKNMNDNANAGELEFVLLDYNSTDGLDQWVKSNCAKYIESGILKYYKTEHPAYFDRSHSRNMAFKLATGDIICNVDADNFLGESFAGYVREEFKKDSSIFITANSRQKDTIGRVCVKRSDFYKVKGYNEDFEGYGFEDFEFYERLKNHNLKPISFSQKEFLNVITHSDDERQANDFKSLNIWKLFISYIKPTCSELMFLYKDKKTETGMLVDEVIEGINVFGAIDKNKTSFLGNWVEGSWKQDNNKFIFSMAGSTETSTSALNDEMFSYQNKLFYEVADNALIGEIQYLCSGIKNRNKLKSGRANPDIIINQNGFGQGNVNENFGRHFFYIS